MPIHFIFFFLRRAKGKDGYIYDLLSTNYKRAISTSFPNMYHLFSLPQ